MAENKPKSILIVEDEEPLVEALKFHFEDAGFTVHTALDGGEGLASALKNHPDMILLDIIMPKVDGLTMLAKLRDNTWGKTANVIILTNVSDYGHSTKAAEYNVYDVLIKSDWDIEDVVKKVKKKLGLE